MIKRTPEITYGHTGDLSILTHLKHDAVYGILSDCIESRVQVNAGGGQLTVLSASALTPLVERGYLGLFSKIIASSSASAFALLAKSVMLEKLTPERINDLLGVYYHDNIRNGLVTRNRGLPHLDIDNLVQTLRSKGLNYEPVRHLNPAILVPVTHSDGSVRMVDLKDEADPFETVGDAMAPVLVSSRAKRRHRHDGSFLKPLPIREMAERGATEILSLLTDPIDLPLGRIFQDRFVQIMHSFMIGPVGSYQRDSGKLRSILGYQIEYLKEVQFIQNAALRPGVNILAFHPTNLAGANSLCMDGALLKQGSLTARSYVSHLLDNA